MIAIIDQFLADPAAGDIQAIMRFSRDSSAVRVVFDQRLLPLTPSAPEGTDAVLLAAYAAGSMRPQLTTGVVGDSPVAGARALLSVYAFLKSKNPAIANPAHDELAARQAAGTLDAAVAERLAAGK